MVEAIETQVARHDERIKTLEAEFCDMRQLLQKIYLLLAGLAGGMFTSLVLLVWNLYR